MAAARQIGTQKLGRFVFGEGLGWCAQNVGLESVRVTRMTVTEFFAAKAYSAVLLATTDLESLASQPAVNR